MAANRKKVLWIAGVLFGLLVLLVGSSLLVPMFIDQETIRAKLQNTLSESTGGTIDFERLDISLFPPRGKLTNISISVPAKDVVGISESATAYLKILPLFRGRVQVGTVEVRRPDFRVGVPEIMTEPEKEPPEGLSLENLAGGAYGALSQLQAMRPNMEVVIEKGRLSLTRRGEPIVMIRDIDAQVELPPDKLILDIHSASNMWESLRVAAKIDREMEGKGRIEVKGLHPHLLSSVLSPPSDLGIGDSEVDAKTRFEMKGYPNIEGDVEASAPKLTIRRGESTAHLKVDTLKGRYRFAEREMQFTLSELQMADPRMKLSGRVYLDRTESNASMEFIGKEMDVDAIRSISLSLAGDLTPVKKTFEIALGGTIDQAVVKSKGKTWRDLAEPLNMDIAATVSRTRVHIPEIELDVEGVTGKLFLSEGTFKGEDLSGRTGTAQATNGSLAVGIQGGNPPFHLDVNLRADLIDSPALLTRIIEDQTFLETMKKIKGMEGTAQGRLVLGEHLKAIRAKVEVSEMNLSGEYEGLPLPVKISRGAFTYEGDQVSWQDLDGRMGKTMITQASGRVDWGEPSRLEVVSDQAVLNFEELHPWITTLGQIPALKEIKSVKGQLALSALQLQGPLKNLTEWTFQGKGELQDLLVESPRIPGVLSVSKASLSGNPERLEVADGQVSLSDADLSLSGAVEAYMKGEPQLNMHFRGTVGPVAKEWITGLLNLPPEIQVRAPLSFSKADLVWGKGKETAFKGDFTVANGPLVSLDVTQGPQEGEIRVRNLVINGSDGRASMSMNLGEKAIDIKFQGDLSETTVREIIEENGYLSGWIRGDFTAHIPKEKPAQSRLNGKLDAGELVFQTGKMKVHRLSLNANGNSARIDVANFGWKGMEVSLTGTDLAMGGKGIDLKIDEGSLCEISTETKDNGSKPNLVCALDATQVSGQFDISGEGSKGFLQSPQGKFVINAGEGRIYRFGLLSKILAVVNITEILKGDAPDLTGKGFGYNSAKFEGNIQNGIIDLTEGSIDGRSVGLAFDGKVNIPERNLDTTVLVAPLKTVDSILNRIPILSGILGKDFIAIPVRVKGDWSDPTIIPLSPSAVGSKLLGIVERTLKLPFKPFQPLFGEKDKKG